MSEISDESVKNGSENGSPVLWLKVALLAMFLFGVLMRIFIPILTFQRLADLLMAIAVLCRLFMYVRSLHPSIFLPKENPLSELHLVDKPELTFSNYDQRSLSPLERVISDK
jgi:hypothetical protein